MEKNDEHLWTPEAVVLCAGDWPTHPLPLGLLTHAERTVCCDSAAATYATRLGRLPWRAVGDGDSLPPEWKQQMADRLTIVGEQESNDQTKAMRLLRSLGLRRVAIVGATGRREDHTLGNIALLAEYHRMGMDVRMYTDHGLFLLPRPGTNVLHLTLTPGSQLSIFPLGRGAIRATGVKFPLPPRLTSWWQGTLNEAVQPQVHLEADDLFMVFVPFEA